jgi:hypothetical protein
MLAAKLLPTLFGHQMANLYYHYIRGRLVKDKASKSPKLNCRNWECGVVIPISKNVPFHLDSSSSAGTRSIFPESGATTASSASLATSSMEVLDDNNDDCQSAKGKGKGRKANAVDNSNDEVDHAPGPASASAGPSRGMQIFNGIVPVPMVVPGEEYGKRRPWFYGENRSRG